VAILQIHERFRLPESFANQIGSGDTQKLGQEGVYVVNLTTVGVDDHNAIFGSLEEMPVLCFSSSLAIAYVFNGQKDEAYLSAAPQVTGIKLKGSVSGTSEVMFDFDITDDRIAVNQEAVEQLGNFGKIPLPIVQFIDRPLDGFLRRGPERFEESSISSHYGKPVVEDQQWFADGFDDRFSIVACMLQFLDRPFESINVQQLKDCSLHPPLCRFIGLNSKGIPTSVLMLDLAFKWFHGADNPAKQVFQVWNINARLYL
jgi:hypothetical protein